MTVSEGCLIKLLLYILFEKYMYILALEMAIPGNQHCANCIGTLSFPVADNCRIRHGDAAIPRIRVLFYVRSTK